MSSIVDLIAQVKNRLPKRFGGTGNDQGHADGVVMQFNARAAIPLYSPVRVSADDNRIATSTTEDDVQIAGVVIGKYGRLTGDIEPRFIAAAPSNSEVAAVMQSGRTKVRVLASVSRDQYALQSTTAGISKGSNLAAGAFGRFLAGGSNSVLAQVWPTSLGGGGGSGSGGVDRLVAVSTNDSTPYYLGSKLVPGIGISITEQNDGANENLIVSALGSNTLYNPQRLVYWDDCTETSLPVGASSTGQLTYDSSRLRRTLGGTSASEYILPSQNLNGPIIVEVIHENLNAPSTGDFIVKLLRVTGDTLMACASYQTDANHVVYIDSAARAASTASGQHPDIAGHLHRSVLHVNEQKYIGVTMGDAAYGPLENTEGSISTGRIGEAGAAFAYTGTLNAGDAVYAKVTTTLTRSVAIYGVRVYRGAIAAPLGNTLALSSNTPANVVMGQAAIVGTGSTAARSDVQPVLPFATAARFFD